MNRLFKKLGSIIVFLLAIFLFQRYSFSESSKINTLKNFCKNNNGELVYVTKVIDGDTIHASITGKDYKIRYIGIDTPELEKEPKLANAAKQANESLVLNKYVCLIKDISETDKYGRLLRYVYVIQGYQIVFVNAWLVRNGYARILTIPPDVSHAKEFLELQRQAQKGKLGIWKRD